MSRSSNSRLTGDLFSLWFQAPMVIALRTQQMGIAMLTGGKFDNMEMHRMVSEKAAATAQSIVAANIAIMQHAMDVAMAGVTGRKPASTETASMTIAHAAVKPYAKRVRANNRRLSRKKV